jgi:tetratricopeptide (TPR) repeat protein
VELDFGFDDDDHDESVAESVAESPVDAAPAAPDRTAELMALTSKELTRICKKEGLSGAGKKAEKVARILAAESGPAQEDPEDLGEDLGPDLETMEGTASGEVQAAVAEALSEIETEPEPAASTDSAEPVELAEPATPTEPSAPTLTLEDLEPIDSADNLDFSSVGIPTWKVKVKIGLTYDFSDFRTLQKYIHDGRVTNEDTISYDKGESWKTLGDIPDLEAYFIEVFQVAKLARARELALEPAPDIDEAPSLSSPLGADLAQEALRQVTEEEEAPAPTTYGPTFEDPFERLKSQQSQRNSTRQQHQAVRAEKTQRQRVASQRQVMILSVLAIAASMVFWMSKDLDRSSDAPASDDAAMALPTAPLEDPVGDLRKQLIIELEKAQEEKLPDPFLEDMETKQRVAVRPPGMGEEDAPGTAEAEDATKPARQLTTLRSPGDYARAGEEAMGKGDYSLAMAEFKNALAGNPRQASWRANYGKCLYRMGQFADARDELVQAQRAGASDTEVLQMLVDSFTRLGDPAGASTYRQILDR